jgi:hypothetical protein
VRGKNELHFPEFSMGDVLQAFKRSLLKGTLLQAGKTYGRGSRDRQRVGWIRRGLRKLGCEQKAGGDAREFPRCIQIEDFHVNPIWYLLEVLFVEIDR